MHETEHGPAVFASRRVSKPMPNIISAWNIERCYIAGLLAVARYSSAEFRPRITLPVHAFTFNLACLLPPSNPNLHRVCLRSIMRILGEPRNFKTNKISIHFIFQYIRMKNYAPGFFNLDCLHLKGDLNFFMSIFLNIVDFIAEGLRIGSFP